MKRLFAILGFALLLPASAALGAPPLLLPHDGPVAKSEKPKPFQSEGHRVQLNLHGIKGLRRGDEVELRLPNGTVHTLVFERVKDEGGGIVTWMGFHRDAREKLRAIVTTGPGGSYGRISTPDGDYRLVPGEGYDWLVDMVAEQPHLPMIDLRDDVRIPPPLKRMYPMAAPEFVPSYDTLDTIGAAKATPPIALVDLMVVYTNGYAANLGSSLQERLNFLVASANAAFEDSEVYIQLRLVHSVAVNYTDTAKTNSEALEEITPAATAPFGNIETLRAQYGADLVTLLRSGSSFGGSGVAWVANGPVDAAFAPYMYSVVTGCLQGCEWVWVHEIGHNMGNMHDRATASWQAGGTSNPPQGSYAYSYGYYSCSNTLSCNPNIAPGAGGCAANVQPECSTSRSGTNNFADIMAYFHQSTTRNLKFSNPNLECRGALNIPLACGVVEGQANAANAALSMNNNRAALSALRATMVTAPAPTTTAITASAATAPVAVSLTFTADVGSGSGTPTGTVHFRDNGASITGCTAVTLSARRATCTASFGSGGTHAVTATYAGNSTNSASVSEAVNVTVTPVASTISLASTPNPSTIGSGIALLARVTGAGASPTGTVHFRNGGVTIPACSAVSLSSAGATSATAMCTTSSLVEGESQVTAHYSGSATYNPVDSTVLTHTVVAAAPPPANPPRLGNLSTRMQVLGGNDVMIGGFVIGGSASKTVVIRARGPSLAAFGVANALADPTIQLVRSSDSATLATNDDWITAPNAAAITASGFAPANDRESAILASLAPGAYTAIVAGFEGGTGVGLIEVFEVDAPNTPLANISTRGQVLGADNVMIGGFVVQGTEPQTVVIRARGPSLAAFGIANALANPTLQLVRSSDGVTIASNDNWGSAANAAAITASGLAPSNGLESAILVTLAPGAYTAVVSGVAGVTGVGIVEVFAQ